MRARPKLANINPARNQTEIARETQTAHFKRAGIECWQRPNLHINLSTAIPYSLLKCVISQENFERARQSENAMQTENARETQTFPF